MSDEIRCYCGVSVYELEASCWYCHYRHQNWETFRLDEKVSQD